MDDYQTVPSDEPDEPLPIWEGMRALTAPKPTTRRPVRNTKCPPDERTPENETWNDWRWQMRNRIRTLDQLHARFPALASDAGIANAMQRFSMAITPYYASLIRSASNRDPIYKMAVPHPAELRDPAFLRDDPLHEDEDMPVPGLVHRYRDRALLIVTSACAMYCRHCTRKRIAGHREGCMNSVNLARAICYLRDHPEIHDVIISGGDPFTMSTAALERIVADIRSVPSVDIIRIGTRTPVTLPMRITPELTAMLRRYAPIWVNTHFNHPRELTREASAACAGLVDAGIPLGNQSVLLRGINDTPEIMEELLRGLVKRRVRPYYLFQCDLVRGVEHFRTPISRGMEIMEYLRGRVSGLAIPTYVVDAPGGGGKIPVLPNYVVTTSPTHTVLRNFEGMFVTYPEPVQADRSPRNGLASRPGATVWDLASGQRTALVPGTSEVKLGRRESGDGPDPLLGGGTF